MNDIRKQVQLHPSMQMPRTRTIILSTIALAIAIQLAPIAHDNPPATASLTTPAPVASILCCRSR